MKYSCLALMVMVTVFFSACKKSAKETVSPSNPNALTSALVIPNATTVNSPNLPTSSSANVAPVITTIDNNISYSSGSKIFIPLTANSKTSAIIKGVYVQVKGASSYFDLTLPNGIAASAIYSLPINVSDIVGAGNFIVVLKLYDNAGNISMEYEVSITVTNPSSCGTTKVSGGEGVTSTVFSLPKIAGSLKISYNTYTVPDKIDVFQNGVWMSGTGSSTVRSTLRRPLSCAVATAALGYVGKKSEFNFNYDPSLGQYIEVVVSGCENGGTAWEYTFSCPEQIVTPNKGQGTFNLDGISYSGICFNSVGANCTNTSAFDVTISNNNSGSGYASCVISNIPPQNSGSYPFVLYSGNKDCALVLTADVLSLSPPTKLSASNVTGSVTKTGVNSFTFNESFTDQMGFAHTISGSGSY